MKRIRIKPNARSRSTVWYNQGNATSFIFDVYVSTAISFGMLDTPNNRKHLEVVVERLKKTRFMKSWHERHEEPLDVDQALQVFRIPYDQVEQMPYSTNQEASALLEKESDMT